MYAVSKDLLKYFKVIAKMKSCHDNDGNNNNVDDNDTSTELYKEIDWITHF